MKVYVLKSWHTNTVYKDRGEWINHKVTLSERDAEWWIEPPARTWDGEGPDPNSDYDTLDLECPDFLADEMVEEKANEWAEKLGEADSEERRKQIVRDFTEGFKLAKALYCKEEKKEETEKVMQSNTLTGVVIKSEPRKWKGWKDKDYISGKMIVYNKNIFKNKFPGIQLIALENVRNLDNLSIGAKVAVAVAGNKYFVTNPSYQHMIEDIIPIDEGLKVIIEDEKYKKDLENSVFPYGVYGDKKDPYSWEYAEIPFKFEVKKKEEPAKRKFGDIVRDTVVRGFAKD